MAVDILNDTKILLDIGDTTQDGALNIYIRKAVTLITTYLNVATEPVTTTDYWTGVTTTIQPVDVAATYPDAVIQYVIENFRLRGNEGLKQFSQGSRSGTYNGGLSQDVINLLPLPYVGTQSAGSRYDY